MRAIGCDAGAWGASFVVFVEGGWVARLAVAGAVNCGRGVASSGTDRERRRVGRIREVLSTTGRERVGERQLQHQQSFNHCA